MSREEATVLRKQILADMIAAIDRALEQPWPDAEEGMKSVFMSEQVEG
jgi:hypothetical protein